jgi:hypothetical protein
MLPAGLSLNPSTGLLSGTPTTAGSFSFTLMVTDAAGAVVTQTFTLPVQSPPPVVGTLTGTVFFDPTVTGNPTANEALLPGVTVFVDLNGNGVLDSGEPSASTDANGVYSIPNLAAGSYTVRVVSTPGVAFTVPAGGVASVTLAAGQTLTQNFGEVLFSPVAPVFVQAKPFGSGNTDPNVAYIRGLYQVLLGHDASNLVFDPTSGMTVTAAQFWVNRLNAGLSRQTVATLIATSPEHYELEVNSYFLTMLHRDLVAHPDPQAFYWVDLLVAGMGEAKVVQGIMDSQEFQSEHPDNASFAQDVYLDILGRLPSMSELMATENLLAAGFSRSSEEAVVINSLESAQRQVTGFYAAFFHRLPESPDNGWVQELLGGTSAAQVEASILSDPVSQEFFRDAQNSLG